MKLESIVNFPTNFSHWKTTWFLKVSKFRDSRGPSHKNVNCPGCLASARGIGSQKKKKEEARLWFFSPQRPANSFEAKRFIIHRWPIRKSRSAPRRLRPFVRASGLFVLSGGSPFIFNLPRARPARGSFEPPLLMPLWLRGSPPPAPGDVISSLATYLLNPRRSFRVPLRVRSPWIISTQPDKIAPATCVYSTMRISFSHFTRLMVEMNLQVTAIRTWWARRA